MHHNEISYSIKKRCDSLKVKTGFSRNEKFYYSSYTTPVTTLEIKACGKPTDTSYLVSLQQINYKLISVITFSKLKLDLVT